MPTNSNKKVFLLGGHDLEMLTIKELLEKVDDCIVVDKQLDWENAQLSAYKEELRQYADHELYGVELKSDIPPADIPKSYHRIDHHNDYSDRKSSLVQVAKVLGVKLSREELLVAANDSGYIPAMRELGATDKEVADIRRRDRAAQGVSEADEQKAEESIRKGMKCYRRLLVVKSQTSHFSAICDRLYPYRRLLIYNDSKWEFYGEDKKELVDQLDEDIRNGKVYHGGGDKGFIGAVAEKYTKYQIKDFVKTVVCRYRYSYHNFMFPFRWEIDSLTDQTFTEQIKLSNIPFDEPGKSPWERCVTTDDEEEQADLYNERNYFYEFVHDALYDNGSDDSLVRHFERREPKKQGVTYVVDCGKDSDGTEHRYELRVGSINLNLYSTGVGVLSFHLYNEDYPEPADVLRINQAGRRVFPPFYAAKNGQRSIIAQSIELQGLEGNYREDFNAYTPADHNTPAGFITALVKEVAVKTERDSIKVKPVVDDRMFVNCWYRYDRWADHFKGKHYKSFLYSSQWYEFVFVDNLYGLTCQNDEMQRQLIERATYARWQKFSSLYGLSRYSMVYLTNSGCPPFQLKYFETIYARMAELTLVQKASVLRFSAEVTNLSNMDKPHDFSEKVASLYKEYIRFVNQIHFREISAQDQGIELYHKLYETLNLEKQVEKLDAEIGELYNYVSLREDRKSNSTMSRLTWIATIAVPLTVVAGFFGMNNTWLDGSVGSDSSEHLLIYQGYVQVAALVGFTLLCIVCIAKYEALRKGLTAGVKAVKSAYECVKTKVKVLYP